jgi:hypothetical protein
VKAQEAADDALERSADKTDDGPEHGEDRELSSAFRRSVHDGQARLNRTWPALLATGLVGGVDLSVGVAALLVVETASGSHLLGSLAFTIGFVGLTLAKSELFTENFLVPVAAVVAAKASAARLMRLWGGTLVMNLVAACLLMHLVVTGLPDVAETAVSLGRHYPERKEKVLNRVRSLRGGKLYDATFGTRMTGEGVWAGQLKTMFDLARRRAGLDRPGPTLSKDKFRRPGGPQMTMW